MDKHERFTLIKLIDNVLLNECKGCKLKHPHSMRYCLEECVHGQELQVYGQALDPETTNKNIRSVHFVDKSNQINKEVFEQLVKEGLRPAEICKRLNIKESSYYYYRNKFFGKVEETAKTPSKSKVSKPIQETPELEEMREKYLSKTEEKELIELEKRLEILEKQKEADQKKLSYAMVAVERADELEQKNAILQSENDRLQESLDEVTQQLKKLQSYLFIVERDYEKMEEQLEAFKQVVKVTVYQ